MALFSAFRDELRRKASLKEGEEAARFLDFANAHESELGAALQGYWADGSLGTGVLPASAFNDFYKWTMLPVMRAVEKARGGVTCTVSVNVRNKELREKLVASAKIGSLLFQSVEASVRSMAARPFDRQTFELALEQRSVPGWDAATLDSVCGVKDKPRTLAQDVIVDLNSSEPRMPSSKDSVVVHLFVAYDRKLGEERLFAEATGPWHLVTWLECPLMQAVYEPLLRDEMRRRLVDSDSEIASALAAAESSRPRYGTCSPCTCWDRGKTGMGRRASISNIDSKWYPGWLADAVIRLVKSTDTANKGKMKTLLMTGRRTGGMPLILIQAMYHHYALRDDNGQSLFAGSSSVYAHYQLINAGVPLAVGPAGTHAHELQMVLGALLSELDDSVGAPLSSAISHALYFYLSLPLGDTVDPKRKILMPFLPDTLGTLAFMKTVQPLKVPHGKQLDSPLLDAFGMARHDSGDMATFKATCQKYGFKGGFMASEISTPEDLNNAVKNGYVAMGAGGFFGDSENAWNSSVKNISMAAKMLRVYEGPDSKRTASHPMKTGDDVGKFEADGLLSADDMEKVRQRADVMTKAELKISTDELQSLFASTLQTFIPQPSTS